MRYVPHWSLHPLIFDFFYIILFDPRLGLCWSLHALYYDWVGLPPSLPGAPIPLRPRAGECANDGPAPPANPHPLLTEHSATRLKGDICTHSTYLSSPSCPPCSIHASIHPSPLLISTSSTSIFSPTTTSFRSPRSCRSFSARIPTISIHVATNASVSDA